MRNYDVILFDLDGTLTDSAPGILNSVRYACRKLGLPIPGEETLDLMFAIRDSCAAFSAHRLSPPSGS